MQRVFQHARIRLGQVPSYLNSYIVLHQDPFSHTNFARGRFPPMRVHQLILVPSFLFLPSLGQHDVGVNWQNFSLTGCSLALQLSHMCSSKHKILSGGHFSGWGWFIGRPIASRQPHQSLPDAINSHIQGLQNAAPTTVPHNAKTAAPI